MITIVIVNKRVKWIPRIIIGRPLVPSTNTWFSALKIKIRFFCLFVAFIPVVVSFCRIQIHFVILLTIEKNDNWWLESIFLPHYYFVIIVVVGRCHRYGSKLLLPRSVFVVVVVIVCITWLADCWEIVEYNYQINNNNNNNNIKDLVVVLFYGNNKNLTLFRVQWYPKQHRRWSEMTVVLSNIRYSLLFINNSIVARLLNRNINPRSNFYPCCRYCHRWIPRCRCHYCLLLLLSLLIL